MQGCAISRQSQVVGLHVHEGSWPSTCPQSRRGVWQDAFVCFYSSRLLAASASGSTGILQSQHHFGCPHTHHTHTHTWGHITHEDTSHTHHTHTHPQKKCLITMNEWIKEQYVPCNKWNKSTSPVLIRKSDLFCVLFKLWTMWTRHHDNKKKTCSYALWISNWSVTTSKTYQTKTMKQLFIHNK